MMELEGKTILITGGAHRIGRTLALAAAQAGGDVIIHYGRSGAQALETQSEIQNLGRTAYTLQADLSDPAQVQELLSRALEISPVFALVNNAAIFESLDWESADLMSWNRHMMINLTAPFLLSQAFALSLNSLQEGRIINILDWRALKPGADHLPYTISKAGLAALTKSLAQAFGPQINVNGIALGAILPPSHGGDVDEIVCDIPAQRWAALEEVQQTLLFLLTGPRYVTGEIIHLDGGKHLV
jgi:NAD(P)-dependent dehydrogenase (short-subunit alcohol dehydrogenase family)